MARGNAVELATQRFATQTTATLFFKDMLSRYQPGRIVEDEDALHLAALLERHDEYKTKVGCGVDHFAVMMTEHGTPCFRIVRRDGTGTDFSYRHCITQRPPTRKQEVSQAFRRAVRFDLYKARDEFVAANRNAEGMVTCAETAKLIHPDKAHMDHRAPMTFEVLVTTFLEGRGLGLEDVPITSGEDEQVSPEITDNELTEAFRRYHAKLAVLDLVENRINLSQSGRHRMKPSRIKLTL
jgi:Protein of unknown function (DUF3223)